MSSFTTPLRFEALEAERDGRGLAVVLEDFEFHVGTYPSSEVIRVPAGYVTDFASIPAIARPLFSPYDRSAKAAVVHDYLLDHPELGYSRRQADYIFKDALEVLGVSAWKRSIMFAAVRLRSATLGKF